MYRIPVLLAIMIIQLQVIAQHPSIIREYNKTYTTYPFGDPSPIPLLSPVYPYYRFDGFTSTPVQKSWKVVELENDYIKILILPEIGGKIWTAIEKSTGRAFLYDNHSVKFRDIAMRGPWTSGGLESNFGIIGHTPNCATPVDYITKTNEDGSVSCIIGALDLLTRSNWTMEINLPGDKACFTTRAHWFNRTPEEQPYYHWMNAGLKAGHGLEFIYPGNKYLGHEGEYADWPINPANGKNLSFYDQNDFGGPKSYHVFGKYTDFAGAYWHEDSLGMVRYGSHDDKAGKKIWIWGLSRQGMIWEKMLTDTDGQYVELQSGRLFNQNADKSSLTPFKHRSLSPYQTDTWIEYWYPVLRTEGMVKANEYGALNIKQRQHDWKIWFCPVQSINDSLVIRQGNRIIYTRLLALAPLQNWTDSIPFPTSNEYYTVTLGKTKLSYTNDPHADELSRPVDAPVDFDWNSAYGLYIAGKEAMDQKNYPVAEEKLRASVALDPHYLPALVKLAELCYRNMRYEEALERIKAALSIDTEDGAANYFYGLINERLNRTTDSRDGFDIASLDPAYRTASDIELSKIYLKEQDPAKALVYAQKALDFDRYAIEALQVQAVAYRSLHDETRARSVFNSIANIDGLNHFSRFESYCWHPGPDSKKAFTTMIRNELPQETYLELAIWYYNIGYRQEAETLFGWCPATPEASYWLAFLQNQPPDLSHADLSRSFPFRSETAIVLEALNKQQDNWKLKYQLALIYHDRNRLPECRDLLRSCQDQPDYAPFYAVRAAICASDTAGALTDLKKALVLDDQWRYRKLLASWYLDHQQYGMALNITEPWYLKHRDQYIMGMLYAKALLFNGRYEQADNVLGKLNIIPFEGATEGHELYREAILMQALQQMQQKHYQKALIFIDKAQQWPENLGVGQPYLKDIDLRLEQWLSWRCLQAMDQKDKANDFLQKIVDFQPGIHNTVANFFGSGGLVTAWSLEQTAGTEQATQWLDEQRSKYPGNKLLQWSRARFLKQPYELPVTDYDANTRILEKLISMEQ